MLKGKRVRVLRACGFSSVNFPFRRDGKERKGRTKTGRSGAKAAGARESRGAGGRPSGASPAGRSVAERRLKIGARRASARQSRPARAPSACLSQFFLIASTFIHFASPPPVFRDPPKAVLCFSFFFKCAIFLKSFQSIQKRKHSTTRQWNSFIMTGDRYRLVAIVRWLVIVITSLPVAVHSVISPESK